MIRIIDRGRANFTTKICRLSTQKNAGYYHCNPSLAALYCVHQLRETDMNNLLLDTAQNLYNTMGRDAAINFMRANWKVSSTKALEEIIDLINYVADMAEMER